MTGGADTVPPGPAADELRQAIADVEAALDQASISGDAALRREVYVLLLEQRLAVKPSDRSAAVGEPVHDPLDREFATPAQRAAAIGRFLDIPATGAEELFDLDGPKPSLRLDGSRLPAQNAAAVRVIALLTCAAHAAVRAETGTAELRDAAERYGKCDGNFYAHLNDMTGIDVRGKPQSANRKVQLLFGGSERAAEIARDLLAS